MSMVEKINKKEWEEFQKWKKEKDNKIDVEFVEPKPEPKPELRKEDLIKKSEPKKEDEYECGECGAKVKKGQEKCDKCGAILNWAEV